VDTGFGCVELVVAGAKQNIYFIAHIKNAHALFPKTHLEEAMKDAPRVKWLTMETTIDGIEILAIAYKYNSKRLYSLPKVGKRTLIEGPVSPYIIHSLLSPHVSLMSFGVFFYSFRPFLHDFLFARLQLTLSHRSFLKDVCELFEQEGHRLLPIGKNHKGIAMQRTCKYCKQKSAY
jgi:hypothetical protein